MRILFITLLFNLLLSCTDKHEHGSAVKGDTLISQSLSADSVKIQAGSMDAVQRYIDSIGKANGGKVSITVINAVETPGQYADTTSNNEILKTLDNRGADSILKNNKQKHTLFHFWATYCGPCKKEFPEILKKAKNLNDLSIILISCDINTKDQRKKVLSYYRSLKTELPLFMAQSENEMDLTGHTRQNSILNHFGLQSTGGLPFNLLVDTKTKKVLASTGDYLDAFAMHQRAH